MANKKADDSKSKNKEKVFDVAKPGESAANATARPVIVGHGSSLKTDPMVKSDNETGNTPDMDDDDTKTAPVLSSEKKVVKPISEDLSTDEKTKSIEPLNENIEAPDNKVDTKEETATNEIESDNNPSDEENIGSGDETTEAGAVDALAQEVSSKKEAVKAEENAKKKQAEIDKLVAEKKYFVPIGEEAHRKSHRLLALILIVLLIVAAGGAFLYAQSNNLIGRQPVNSSQATTSASTKSTSKIDNSEFTIYDKASYTSPNIPINFNYPKQWKVTTGSDPNRPDIKLISLTSPNFTVNKDIGGKSSQAEVFQRVNIYIQPKKYPASETLKVCNTEKKSMLNKQVYIALISNGGTYPEVGQATVSTTDCKKSADEFEVSNDVQLTKSDNEIMVISEYVMSEKYIKSLGSLSAQDIALAQLLGITLDPSVFKSTNEYRQFIDLVNTIKEN